MQLSKRLVATSILSAMLAACAGDAPTGPSARSARALAVETPVAMTVTSPAFTNGAVFPVANYCPDLGGSNTPPALAWQGLPRNTKSIAIMMDDPDAVPVPSTFTHWITWNISPTATVLPPRALRGVGSNDLYFYKDEFGIPDFFYRDYFGPCPPPGTGVHHYTFHVYALSSTLTLAQGSTRDAFLAAIAGKVLGQATLMGTVDSGQ